MTTKEVAERLTELCNQGQNAQAIEELYADNVVSVEPKGAPMELCEGKEAVKAKTEGFMGSVEEFHSAFYSDPVVGANHFAISMGMDITFKGQGRMKMEEIGVYQVENGKITREEFFFPAG